MNNPEVKEIWNRVVNGKEELMISVLTINEILVHFFRKGKTKTGKDVLTDMKLFPNITIIPVDERIAEISAGYRHGLGIPTIDSLILTTFISQQCDKVVSTDEHFIKAKKQNIINVKYIKPEQ